jgi:hypothetical protein
MLPLIHQRAFDEAQRLLETQNFAGEKKRKHHHLLAAADSSTATPAARCSHLLSRIVVSLTFATRAV